MALSGTLYFVGLIIGSLIGGIPADVFGRKPVLFFFIFVGGFGNLIGGLVSTFPLYVLFRLIAGIGEQGTFNFTKKNLISLKIENSKFAFNFTKKLTLTKIVCRSEEVFI